MKTSATIELLAQDLTSAGGTYCPNPKAGMPVTSNHPKVYLTFSSSNRARCPYCGTTYQLKAGEHFDSCHTH